MAAVLASGEGAVLSHGAAAVLWGLLRPIKGPVDITVPTQAGRARRRAIRVHRCVSLTPNLTTYRKGIPVTTVPRTIEDIRDTLPPYLVRRAIRQAEFIGLRLDGIETNRTRSDLEEEFLDLCEREGLPLPEVNVKLGRYEVDFLWRARHLVVETDSFNYHRGSVAFEEDHARDLDLRHQGFAVLRFTGRQLEEEPGRVVADVARALATGGLSAAR